MVRQQIKDALYAINRWVVLPVLVVQRWRYRRVPPEGYRLHLGCGRNYIPGMINCDGNRLRRIDCWLDLRNPLPFPDGSASFVYCSHTLEHLFLDEACRLLREIRRVLRPDGVCRLATPSMERALEIAASRATSHFPRRFDDPLAQAINYLFCDGQHKYAYSFGLMHELATAAGFSRVENRSATDGVSPKEYAGVRVGEEPEGSLVVELRP